MIAEKVSYGGWPNCYRLSNGIIELIVTTDVGPRILHLGFPGEANELCEFPEVLGKTGGNEWHSYGGHRLWHAPEDSIRSYFPDNFPIRLEKHDPWVRLIQPVEPTTGIEKEIDLYLSPDQAAVRLVHRLRNHNLWDVELAPWAVTVMAAGGTAIFPMPPRGSHPADLLPVNHLSLWSYTDLSDPRWTWGKQYILLRQDEKHPSPQKIGASIPDGWLAYARQGHLFVKTFQPVPGANYPDFGCPVESFVNQSMLELETLGPLTRLKPGAVVEHMETWHLFSGVSRPASDQDVNQQVLPKALAAREQAARLAAVPALSEP